MLLKSITTKGNQTLELGPLTVLVGPNNCGKSEFLRDIYRLLLDREPPRDGREGDKPLSRRVLTEVRLVSALTPDQMLRGLRSPLDAPDGGQVAQGLHADLCSPYSAALRKDAWRILSRPDLASEAMRQSELLQLMPLKLAYCPVSIRWKLGNASAASSPAAPAANFLQLLQLAGPDVQRALGAACKEVFGREIRLDASERVNLCLRVGEQLPPEPADPFEAVRLNAGLARLEDEGDGFRSFVGTVLSLLLLPGRLVLLDQPEAFLHPDQCEKLGRWLATQAEEQRNQVVLATHSVALLSGLLSRTAQVGVLRLSRTGPDTRVLPLPQPVLKALGQSPQLAGQRSLEVVFHDGVVITTSDVDRAVFSTVAAGILGQSRIAFLECRGRMYVASLLKLFRAANLPACAAVDLRIFDSANAFAELVEVAAGNAAPRGWLRIRQKLADIVEGLTSDETLAESTLVIEQFLDQVKRGVAEPDQRLMRESKLARGDRWSKFNQEGSTALPRELRLWVQELIEELKRCGVFVSPKGNAENWFDLEAARDHTDDWYAAAMTQLMQGQCPMELRIFVSEMLQFVQAAAAPPRPARPTAPAPAMR